MRPRPAPAHRIFRRQHPEENEPAFAEAGRSPGISKWNTRQARQPIRSIDPPKNQNLEQAGFKISGEKLFPLHYSSPRRLNNQPETISGTVVMIAQLLVLHAFWHFDAHEIECQSQGPLRHLDQEK